jgi:DNA polymerase III alpha subunit
MASFSFEDQTGAVRVVAFTDAFDRCERTLAEGACVLVTASLRASDAEHVELGLEEATPLEGIEARKAAALRVELDLEHFGDSGAVECSFACVLWVRTGARSSCRAEFLGSTPTR